MEGNYQMASDLMDTYQENAAKTAVYQDSTALIIKEGSQYLAVKTLNLSYLACGLTEESGEVSGKVKKLIRNHQGEMTAERKAELIKELGDVLWYVALLAKELNVKLSAVAEINLSKLHDRKERNVIAAEGDNR